MYRIQNLNIMRFYICRRSIAALILTFCILNSSKAQTDVLFGGSFGMAFTSNPQSLQIKTGKSHYVDYVGQFLFLTHTQVNDNYSYEFQFPCPILGIYSSVNYLEHADNETKLKFTFPFDVRFFLGDQTLSGYVGAGIQYSTVWNFISSDGDSSNSYYDPWWGYYYEESYQDDDKLDWEWTAHQLSTNLAVGLKLGMFNAEARDPKGSYISYRPFSLMLGVKFHFPLINNGETHGDESSGVDLSRDKTSVSLTGGFSINWPRGAFKIDYEYPLGGTNKYALYDGGHATFFNTRSQSLSATLLFKL